MAVLPQASATVQVRVTVVGQVPEATSIYVTVVMPQTSLAAPLFGALVNTANEEVAEVVEKGGEVIAEVLQPSIFRA